MAKHAVPKQKQSKARSSSRYNTFANSARKRLLNASPIVTCSQCGQSCVNHKACPACGMYRGRKVIDLQKKMEKVTKIKA